MNSSINVLNIVVLLLVMSLFAKLYHEESYDMMITYCSLENQGLFELKLNPGPKNYSAKLGPITFRIRFHGPVRSGLGRLSNTTGSCTATATALARECWPYKIPNPYQILSTWPEQR